MAVVIPSVITLLLLHFASLAFAADLVDPELTGTWTTKSRKVLTGPGFYDPVKEEFKEPTLPGISYSFTDDGFYEEAYYRATSDPVRPECAGGIMQFQHGTYTRASNGSLYLTPFAEDGRELVSNPCKGKMSTYTVYNQTETFKRYEITTDPFNGATRLNLFKWDGSPTIPMFLALRPPEMLPTRVLNPVDQGSSKRSKPKRDPPMGMSSGTLLFSPKYTGDRNFWLWVSMTMVSIGGILFIWSLLM